MNNAKLRVIRALPESECYCPYCGVLVATNAEAVADGIDENYIFTHSENHTDTEVETDMIALDYPIQ